MENASSGWCDNVFLLCNLARISSVVYFQFLDSGVRQYFFILQQTQFKNILEQEQREANVDRYM